MFVPDGFLLLNKDITDSGVVGDFLAMVSMDMVAMAIEMVCMALVHVGFLRHH